MSHDPKRWAEPVLSTEEAIVALDDALAYYDAGDVTRWFERSLTMIGHYPRVKPSLVEAVRTFKKVPNEVFRRAWEPLAKESVIGLRDEEPEWVGLFRHELEVVRAAPETLDSLPRKIGPGNLSMGEITGYLRRVLGVVPASSGESLAWLLDYEVAEALCKTMGLIPVQVGI